MAGEDQLKRVRRICGALPDSSERLSHGEPTFFTKKKVYVMYSNNHHNDGHVAVMIPAAPGMQEVLIDTDPKTYYRPPYVGVKGWVGIELSRVGDHVLAGHIQDAHRLISSGKKAAR